MLKKLDEDGKEIFIDPYPNNILYKANPLADWEHWMFLPPTDKTISILRKEVHQTIAQMKEDGRFAVKRVCTVFQGKSVFAFQFNDGREVYLDK